MAPITTNKEGEFTAQLKGEFHWDLCIDIDNTKNGSASIKREMKVVSEVALSYDALVRSLESDPTDGILEVLSVGVNGDLHPEVKAAYESLPQTKTASVNRKTTEDVAYEVGANSSLKLYRLVFKGPGVIYMSDTLSTSTDAIPHVPIEVKGRIILPALKGVAASYNRDIPCGAKANKLAKLAKDDGHFTAQLKGGFHWELFMDIDNSKNSGAINRTMEVETVVALSHNNMVRELRSSAIDTSIGLDVSGGLFDVISIGVKGNLTTEVKSEYENMTDTKIEKTTTTKKTDTYNVDPNGVLKLYRLVFKGPGVAYMTDTISSSTNARPEVPIEIKGRKIPVLKDIQVVHTDDSISRPDDIIVESRGQDPNIRAEWNSVITYFKRDQPLTYVWLRPIWTTDVSEGVTGIQLADEAKSNGSDQDLMKGVDAGFSKYLKMLRDPHSKHRITEIALWKEKEGENGPPPKKDYKFSCYRVSDNSFSKVLWLAWNTREVQ